jgi:hypothetical protein
MDILLRTIAIIVELLILAVIAYSILKGVKLTALDMGIRTKYRKILTLLMVVVGIIVMFFFIAHLTTFYPEILVERMY